MFSYQSVTLEAPLPPTPHLSSHLSKPTFRQIKHEVENQNVPHEADRKHEPLPVSMSGDFSIIVRLTDPVAARGHAEICGRLGALSPVVEQLASCLPCLLTTGVHAASIVLLLSAQSHPHLSLAHLASSRACPPLLSPSLLLIEMAAARLAADVGAVERLRERKIKMVDSTQVALLL